ncbi:MAG: riboflavin kinase [Patescibacteria group bacterium]
MKFIGKVKKGDQRGRKLGFPTLNLEVSMALEDGVYCVLVEGLPGVMHVGPLPTFSIGRRVEIHILDFDEDWYEREVEVEVFDKIRDVRKFDSVEDLVIAIEGDVKKAREIFT